MSENGVRSQSLPWLMSEVGTAMDEHGAEVQRHLPKVVFASAPPNTAHLNPGTVQASSLSFGVSSGSRESFEAWPRTVRGGLTWV